MKEWQLVYEHIAELYKNGIKEPAAVLLNCFERFFPKTIYDPRAAKVVRYNHIHDQLDQKLLRKLPGASAAESKEKLNFVPNFELLVKTLNRYLEDFCVGVLETKNHGLKVKKEKSLEPDATLACIVRIFFSLHPQQLKLIQTYPYSQTLYVNRMVLSLPLICPEDVDKFFKSSSTAVTVFTDFCEHYLATNKSQANTTHFALIKQLTDYLEKAKITESKENKSAPENKVMQGLVAIINDGLQKYQTLNDLPFLVFFKEFFIRFSEYQALLQGKARELISPLPVPYQTQSVPTPGAASEQKSKAPALEEKVLVEKFDLELLQQREKEDAPKFYGSLTQWVHKLSIEQFDKLFKFFAGKLLAEKITGQPDPAFAVSKLLCAIEHWAKFEPNTDKKKKARGLLAHFYNKYAIQLKNRTMADFLVLQTLKNLDIVELIPTSAKDLGTLHEEWWQLATNHQIAAQEVRKMGDHPHAQRQIFKIFLNQLHNNWHTTPAIRIAAGTALATALGHLSLTEHLEPLINQYLKPAAKPTESKELPPPTPQETLTILTECIKFLNEEDAVTLLPTFTKLQSAAHPPEIDKCWATLITLCHPPQTALVMLAARLVRHPQEYEVLAVLEITHAKIMATAASPTQQNNHGAGAASPAKIPRFGLA